METKLTQVRFKQSVDSIVFDFRNYAHDCNLDHFYRNKSNALHTLYSIRDLLPHDAHSWFFDYLAQNIGYVESYKPTKSPKVGLEMLLDFAYFFACAVFVYFGAPLETVFLTFAFYLCFDRTLNYFRLAFMKPT